MDTGSIQKQNKIETLKAHKEMLESALYSVSSNINAPDKGAKTKYENKKKDLEEQIKAVDKKLSGFEDKKQDTKKK